MLKTSFLTIIPKTQSCYVEPQTFGRKPVGGATFDHLYIPSVWDIFDEVTQNLPEFTTNFETVFGADGKFNSFEFKDNKYTVELELPRFRKENIKITSEKGFLSIAAEQDNLKYYKTLNLPEDSDGKFEANLDHGVLSVSVGQVAPPKPIEISIGNKQLEQNS